MAFLLPKYPKPPQVLQPLVQHQSKSAFTQYKQSNQTQNFNIPDQVSEDNQNTPEKALQNIKNETTGIVNINQLKIQILESLPELYKSKDGQNGTQSKLLQYFLYKEFFEKTNGNCKVVIEKISKEVENEQILSNIDEPQDNMIKIDLQEEFSDDPPRISCATSQHEQVQVQKPINQNNVKMLITKCAHVNRKHYAKNMCSSCYRKFGRSQNAWKCQHTDRLVYSMGMCQNCYLTDYHKRKSLEIIDQEQKDEQLEFEESKTKMQKIE